MTVVNTVKHDVSIWLILYKRSISVPSSTVYFDSRQYSETGHQHLACTLQKINFCSVLNCIIIYLDSRQHSEKRQHRHLPHIMKNEARPHPGITRCYPTMNSWKTGEMRQPEKVAYTSSDIPYSSLQYPFTQVTETSSPFVSWRIAEFPVNTSPREERGVGRGSSRRSSLKGRERAIVSQTNIGTVSVRGNVGKLLIDGVERIWVFFPERIDTILN